MPPCNASLGRKLTQCPGPVFDVIAFHDPAILHPVDVDRHDVKAFAVDTKQRTLRCARSAAAHHKDHGPDGCHGQPDRRLPLARTEARDLRGTVALIEGLSGGKRLLGRAFDANRLRDVLSEAKAEAVIPPKSNRCYPGELECETCKWRHLIENFFQWIKQYIGIGMHRLFRPRARAARHDDPGTIARDKDGGRAEKDLGHRRTPRRAEAGFHGRADRRRHQSAASVSAREDK